MELSKISLVETDSTTPQVDTNVPSSRMSRSRRTRPKIPKKLLVVLLVIILVLGVMAVAVAIPAHAVMVSANKTYMQAKVAFDAMKKQDIGLTKEELKKTREEFNQTKKEMKALAWTKYIPIVGIYYSDAEHMTNAADAGLDAADTVVQAILPYADVLGLKGQGSFVGGSAEERIQKAVATMDKLTPKIPALEQKVKIVEEELSHIDPNRYPGKVGKFDIKDNLAKGKEITSQAQIAVSQARPLLEVLPKLLGEPKDQRYLVLFQNDKELRPSGGFITAYAIFRISHGVVHLEASNDIYELDSRLGEKRKAPDIILKYLPLVPYFNLRDSNLSPDFYESMQTFESLYDNVAGKVDVDGIIAVDTHVLVTILSILGPTEASGIKYTTDEDKRCNCPQVIYELENYSSRPVGFVREQRKDNIGELMYQIMKKALSSSPKVYWGPLFQSGLQEISQKHIMFYLHDENAQKGLESLNAAGRIKDFEGDYLHINDSNFAGAKSNLYVQEAVDQTIEVAGDGSITKTIKINYTNPQPPSDCNLERGGLCLNGILRDVVRVYVPKGSTLIDEGSRGSEVKIETKEDLGKTYFEAFVTIRPQGKAALEFKYKLPFKLEKGSPYLMLIQKQPGTDQNDYSVSVNGKTEKFKLITDKELKMTL